MGQIVYCWYCCCLRQPIPHLWMAATNRHCCYPRCNGKNHWHSVDIQLTLIYKMVQWLHWLLFCIYRLQIHRLYTVATKWDFNYHTYKTNNHWHSIDADFNVLSIQYLLLPIIAFIIVSTCWLRFCLIETWPFGNAKPSNLHTLVVLILLTYIHLSKCFIMPGILQFVNKYSLVTAQYSPIICLEMKVPVKLPAEPSENTVAYSVLV
jgi:hypothetical protein